MGVNAPTHAEIIDKLQKLRVLAHNKAAMPGEVDAALRAMSALMARYRVSEAELEAAAKKGSVIESEDLWPPAKRVPSWRIILLSALSRPSGCVIHVVAYDDKTRGVRLAGTESDVSIVKSLWSWLEAEAVRLSWGPLAVYPKDIKPKRPKRLMKFQTDWIIGFALGVSQQIEAELQRNASPTPAGSWSGGTSAALILIDQRAAEARAFLQHYEPKPMDAFRGQRPDDLALARGFEAGERYHLGKKLPKETGT
jgi:hypothetical protein